MDQSLHARTWKIKGVAISVIFIEYNSGRAGILLLFSFACTARKFIRSFCATPPRDSERLSLVSSPSVMFGFPFSFAFLFPAINSSTLVECGIYICGIAR